MKRLQLMRQLLPASTSVAVLMNPHNPNADADATALREAAHALGESIRFAGASTETEIDQVLTSFSDRSVSALLVNTDPFFLAKRDQIVSLVARNAIPAIYAQREFVTAGGLMSYGVSL